MSDQPRSEPEFSKLRAFIWPVYNHELFKLIPMLVMFFLISFNYNVLRIMKDTLVVTPKSSGAEVIPFIKVWVMFPGAILMTFLYTRLSNRFSREVVFYLFVGSFLVYFFIYAFILYPNQHQIHPEAFCDKLQEVLPLGFKGLIAMVRNWTATLFYAMSELWGNIILFVLFWGFANQVTKIHEAKRFYGLFGLGANLSGIVAGQVSIWVSRFAFNPNIPLGNSAWDQAMMILVSLILISGVCSMGLFRWIIRHVLKKGGLNEEESNAMRKKVTQKLSMRENFRYLFRSKYVFSIAFIVVAYNIVISLVEVVWKSQVKELYSNPADYNLYMNQVSTIIGVLATFTALFVSGNFLRRFGWTFTALLTPVILFLTSIGFFGFFLYKEQLLDYSYLFFGVSPLAMVVFFGSAQNVMSRAAKYTVFDATKEMAFIPLTSDQKIKGKAAIDGVCTRLGKSGGALMHQTMLILFSTFAAGAPYIAVILLTVIGGWAFATRILGREFAKLTSVQPTSPQPEPLAAGGSSTLKPELPQTAG